MGTSKQYYLHGILLGGATWIGELTDTTPAANVELLTEYASGAVAPSFRGGHGARPDVSFTSPQLKTILDACGMTGAGYLATNVDLYYRKASNLATREAIASLSPLLIRARRSCVYWTSSNAQQGQVATIACRIVPTFDGTNAPLIGLGSQAIPSGLVAEQFYTLGPVKPNGGAAVDGLQGWTLEMNPEINEKASSGEDFLSFVGVRRHDPVWTLTGPDLDYWASIGVDGLQLTALAAYLRKKAEDSTRCEANGNAVHIKFSNVDTPCGLITIDNTTGGMTDEASQGLRIGMRVDDAASSYPLQVATTSQIT